MTFEDWFEKSDVIKKGKHLSYGWLHKHLRRLYSDPYYIDPNDLKSSWDARDEEVSNLKKLIKDLEKSNKRLKSENNLLKVEDEEIIDDVI